MLTPRQIAAIGVQIALRARRTEDACVAALVKMVVDRIPGATTEDAVRMSADVPRVIIGTIAENPYAPKSAVVAEVERALETSMAADARALGITPEGVEMALAPGHDRTSAAQAVAEGLAKVERRDNLAMAEDARRTWLGAVAKYVPQASRGEMAYEDAVRRIVAECAQRGVKAVDYQSGRRDSLDVAARRHIVTQVQQAAASRSFEVAGRMGEGLVYVTSHVGARPSHRAWQGRPYAVHGPLTVDGVTYPDLAEATGYGTVGGLCGANCSHSFGPWLHWQKPPYSPTPDEDQGLDPDQSYRATQSQRANEREIRRAKLEAQSLADAGQDDSEARVALGKAQARQRRLLSENEWLKRRPEREAAYGADGRAVSVRPLKKARKPNG